MGSDFQKLQKAEESLLEAVQTASEVTAKLSMGKTEGLEELCSRFLDNIQESQVALVQLATKFAEPLPYENSAYAAQLKVEAVQHKLQGAEAQLRQLQQQQQEQHGCHQRPTHALLQQHGHGQHGLQNLQGAGFEEV